MQSDEPKPAETEEDTLFPPPPGEEGPKNPLLDPDSA